MRFRAAILLAAAAFTASPAVHAQTWPARTITLVVPFAAGGGTDAIGRVVAEKLAARLGQPVVVENKAVAAERDWNRLCRQGRARRLHAADDDQQRHGDPATDATGRLAQLRPRRLRMIGLTGILPNS